MSVNVRPYLWIVMVAIAPLYSTVSYAVWESTKIHLCNRTDVDLSVAKVANTFYEGVEYWGEYGWFAIKKGQCEYMHELHGDRVVGFAFQANVNDETIDISFEPEGTTGGSAMGIPSMCVRPKLAFSYTQKTKNELGTQCEASSSVVDLSFFYVAHWDDDQNTVVRTSLRGTFLPDNPNQVSGVPELKSRDQAGRKEYAEHLDHKFILKAFSLWKKDSAFYDHESVYIDKVSIEGEAEHAVIYAIMRDHDIGEKLIGEGKQFADYYAYLGGMFHDFSMDYQFDEVLLTDFGYEQIQIFAEKYNLIGDAEKIKQNYIEKGWK
jgi:hypothetical protein